MNFSFLFDTTGALGITNNPTTNAILPESSGIYQCTTSILFRFQPCHDDCSSHVFLQYSFLIGPPKGKAMIR